jgi:hypothetical protein
MPANQEPSKLRCFVVMPLGPDAPPYTTGHFERVLAELIEPACKSAGFDPYVATTSKASEMIIADVLRQLIAADMVVCDMSSRNPNVFFELGLRQAFDKPVAIIKDELTPRPFDVAGLRDYPYHHMLRVDQVREDIEGIAAIIRVTHAKHKTGPDTLLRLINMQPAVLPDQSKASPDTQIIMNALNDISKRLSSLEQDMTLPPWQRTGLPGGRGYVDGLSVGYVGSGGLLSPNAPTQFIAPRGMPPPK